MCTVRQQVLRILHGNTFSFPIHISWIISYLMIVLPFLLPSFNFSEPLPFFHFPGILRHLIQSERRVIFIILRQNPAEGLTRFKILQASDPPSNKINFSSDHRRTVTIMINFWNQSCSWFPKNFDFMLASNKIYFCIIHLLGYFLAFFPITKSLYIVEIDIPTQWYLRNISRSQRLKTKKTTLSNVQSNTTICITITACFDQ